MEEILRLLKTERLARDKVALELVAVQVTAKTLKAAIKAHDAKIADLVTDVARDSYDDRRRAHSLEIASRKSETGERAVH